MGRRIRVAIAAVVGVSIFVAATTSATASSGYNAVADKRGGGGSLPFTGADLAEYVIIGCVVIAGGVALRALSRRTA